MRIESYDLAQGVDPLLQLIQAEYPQGEMSDRNYLNWEYQSNPAGDPAMTVTWSSEGEIVGQYLVIPVRYDIDGSQVEGSLSLNTLTRQDYRGKGLFTKMALATYAECESRGLQLTLGFPNKSSYPGFVRKLHFHHIGNVELLVRPLRVGALIKGAMLRKRHPKYQSYRVQHDIGNVETRNIAGVTISDFDLRKDAALYEEFLRRRSSLHNQTHRSVQYLDWRYRQIPTRKYTLLKATRDGRFLAYIAVRLRVVFGVKAGFIIDLNCLPVDESMAAAQALLRETQRLMRSAGAAFVGALIAPGCAEYRVLRKSRYFQAPSRFLPHDAPVIVRWNGEGEMPKSLGAIDHWFLTFGDYDAF